MTKVVNIETSVLTIRILESNEEFETVRNGLQEIRSKHSPNAELQDFTAYLRRLYNDRPGVDFDYATAELLDVIG